MMIIGCDLHTRYQQAGTVISSAQRDQEQSLGHLAPLVRNIERMGHPMFRYGKES